MCKPVSLGRSGLQSTSVQGSTEEGEVSRSESRWEGFSKEVMSSWTCENKSLNQVIKVRGEVPASTSSPSQAISVWCCLFWSRNFAMRGFRPVRGSVLFGLLNSHVKADECVISLRLISPLHCSHQLYRPRAPRKQRSPSPCQRPTQVQLWHHSVLPMQPRLLPPGHPGAQLPGRRHMGPSSPPVSL